MRANRLKGIWKEGRAATMGWCNLADTYSGEIMAHAGFDAVLLDMQHGIAIGPDRAGLWLQAMGQTNAIPLARVPWNEQVYIQWVLDAGAYGVIVPLVNSYDDAARAGAACRYSPEGRRSVGANRLRLVHGPEYDAEANREIVCLVMIETPQAVERLPEILKAPGIDGVYIGPSDLARSIAPSIAEGRADPRHEQMCQRVLELTSAAGLVPGIHAANAEEAARRFKQGWKISPVAIDTYAIGTFAAGALRQAKDLAAK
jgi:4-hydroxy-2-oxoheptanedioate aldolase